MSQKQFNQALKLDQLKVMMYSYRNIPISDDSLLKNYFIVLKFRDSIILK